MNVDIFILSSDESGVPCKGISQIESVDFEYGKQNRYPIESAPNPSGKMMGHTIKLLGIAEEIKEEKGQKDGTTGNSDRHIALSVCPVMVRDLPNITIDKYYNLYSEYHFFCDLQVPITNPLAHVDGATNAVEIESSNLG